MSSLSEPWLVLRRPEKVAHALPTVSEHAPRAPSVAGELPDAERLVSEARREAFDEGRAAGLAEAVASAEAARRERFERLADAIAQAAAKTASMREEVVEEVGRDLAELVVDLTEVLLGEKVDGHLAVNSSIVRALALAPEGPDLVVKVSPHAALSDDEIRAMANGGAVDVVRDPSVDATGCVVEVGSCRIDAQLSSALDRVRRQLQGVLSR
ncbi:MAG: FliH/SctL family protein [Acidimicrobiales bacterium]